MTTKHTNELRACPTYADLLVDLSDGELPEEGRHGVEEHLATCEGCRVELRRLNSSLARLRAGPAVDRSARVGPACQAGPCRSASGTYYDRSAWLVWTASGAVALACLVGGAWGIWRFAMPAKIPEIVRVPEAESKSPPLSRDDVFRYIALVEQQGRLQASLDFMPDDPWFADQRAANEHLLTKFREATEASVTTSHSPEKTPSSNAAPGMGENL